MSDISYKAYTGETVICRTLAMSTVIIVLQLFVHGDHARARLYVQRCLRTQDSPQQLYVHKESSLVWSNSFLTQGVYRLQPRLQPRLQHKHPAKELSMFVIWSLCYIAIYICAELSSRPSSILCYIQLPITFTLNFGVAITIATCCNYAPIDFILNTKNHS